MPSRIDWCDETINPQGWGCWGPGGTPEKPQRCWYCYVERQTKGPYVPDCEQCRALVPHWHPKRLELLYHWKKPRKIFWQSMGDLFHPCTPSWQIETVLRVVRAFPQHTNIFCTKNSARYQEFNPWPGNCILLTTITGLGKEEEEIGSLLRADCRRLGLSLEPLLGAVNLEKHLYHYSPRSITGDGCGWDKHLNFPRPNWLIIGAYTGKGASRFVPATAWVQSLIDQGRAAGTPIWLKDNLHWPEKIQEWPV